MMWGREVTEKSPGIIVWSLYILEIYVDITSLSKNILFKLLSFFSGEE